ncbi:MAG: glycosyltransferase family 39 protein [Nanoarchaeota archaeon]|nr:glycosyltransferase family 39 protein [Nanoarchaeota archaeon]
MKKSFLKKVKLEIILLCIILLFALFLRVYSLGSSPFWVDEAISARASVMILEKGVPILDSGWHYSSAYFLHYLMAFFMLFGQTEFFARFISVIFGLLTIVLAYFIGKEYSKSGGIISALFFTVFYLEVFFSRQARYYQLFQLAFFASLYFLYKSKENPQWLYLAIIAFFVAIDTHLEALILAPFFILHILYYNRRQWFLSILPVIPLIKKLIPASRLSTGSANVVSNYASKYFSYTTNMLYLIILFIPGLILGFFKRKRLTLTLMIPAIATLIGIFSLQTFAFRYAYFFMFLILLYSAVLFSWLYDRYGKLILIPLFLLIIIPSNLFFPYTYVNVIKPIDYNFNDISAPYTDYKAVPTDVITQLKSDITLISYYSADVEFYIRKPDYALPFTMTGIGEDQVSVNNSLGEVVDRYSGASILTGIPERPYNLVADSFSVSKLKPNQMELLANLTEECEVKYENWDLKIYGC